MSTQTCATTTALPRVHRSAAVIERPFFAAMAMLLCLVVFIGFRPTYYGAGFLRASLPSRILPVHGAVFTAWMLVYLVQSAFISARRVAWHRALGTIAFLLPPIMVVLGVVAAIDALGRGVRIGTLDPEASLAIPLFGIAAFAIVIAAAWNSRRRPGAHKRLIVLATIDLADAALGRFPWNAMGVSPALGAVAGLGVLIALLIGYDLFSLGRLHRSTAWAAPLVFATGAFAAPIGMTSVWHNLAAFLLRAVVPHV